jgi:mevalonate pyrophosphate decarboxylase
MLGFDTTMNGRFLRACIRCARRIGRRDRVKLAEVKRAGAGSGGRPCLTGFVSWKLGKLAACKLLDKISETQSM